MKAKSLPFGDACDGQADTPVRVDDSIPIELERAVAGAGYIERRGEEIAGGVPVEAGDDPCPQHVAVPVETEISLTLLGVAVMIIGISAPCALTVTDADVMLFLRTDPEPGLTSRVHGA
ncbi:MAG TPA: hypothetical protein VK388_08870 [Pyrinomonadaceae bacterium]|nr:hypothetical protein [Pyrinomonadaceae bacterium]